MAAKKKTTDDVKPPVADTAPAESDPAVEPVESTPAPIAGHVSPHVRQHESPHIVQ